MQPSTSSVDNLLQDSGRALGVHPGDSDGVQRERSSGRGTHPGLSAGTSRSNSRQRGSAQVRSQRICLAAFRGLEFQLPARVGRCKAPLVCVEELRRSQGTSPLLGMCDWDLISSSVYGTASFITTYI